MCYSYFDEELNLLQKDLAQGWEKEEGSALQLKVTHHVIFASFS
jgi:hypothetical protein